MPIDLKELISNKKFIPIYLSRKNLNKSKLGPVSAEFHWTSICSYNCIHCSYGNRRRLKKRLSDGVISNVIEDLIALGIKGVYLSGGGEPTTISGWHIYALELIKNNVEVALITNGIKLKKSCLAVLQKMNYIAVSLYSSDKTEYEKITGGKAFEKQFLLPSLLKQKPIDTIIGARCVLNKINYKSVASIYQSAMEAGFDYIIFIPAVDYEGIGISLKKDEISYLHELLIEHYVKFDISKTNVDYLIKQRNCYYDIADYRESMKNPYAGCKSVQIRGNAFINYDGEVYLCQPHIGDKRYCIGNVNEMRFFEIWNSKRHLEIIELLNQDFASGLCKNCRSISFNRLADEFDHNPLTVPHIIKDVFI